MRGVLSGTILLRHRDERGRLLWDDELEDKFMNLIPNSGLNAFGVSSSSAHATPGHANYYPAFGAFRRYAVYGTADPDTLPELQPNISLIVDEGARSDDGSDMTGGMTQVITPDAGNNRLVGEYVHGRRFTFASATNISQIGFSRTNAVEGPMAVLEYIRRPSGTPRYLNVLAGHTLEIWHKLTIRLPWIMQTMEVDTDIGLVIGVGGWSVASGGNVETLILRVWAPQPDAVPHVRWSTTAGLSQARDVAPTLVGSTASVTEVTLEDYILGSFTRTKSRLWVAGEATGEHTAWAMALGATQTAPTACYKFILTSPTSVTKAAGAPAEPTFISSWGRLADE